jgi:hypothetical protein
MTAQEEHQEGLHLDATICERLGSLEEYPR